MIRRSLFPLFLVAVVAAAIVAEVGSSPPATAGGADTSISPGVRAEAAQGSLTDRAVAAAEAFKATLTPEQQTAVQYAFDAASKRTGWSNLPVNIAARNGVAVQALNEAQLASLRALLQTVLSARGYADEEGIRKIDTYLQQVQQQRGGGGGLGGQQLGYGEGLYYVAFFGTPSRTQKWTIQFGGHHLALHLTFSGSTVSNTPYFIGAEPRAAVALDGETYAPMADEGAALFGAVQSLSASQRRRARLSQSFDDVLLGPGEDGEFPARRGIQVSSLSASQQRLVTRAIRSYVGDLPAARANALLRIYRRQYRRTRLAYAGATDGTTNGSYARIHGPRVWIEIVLQNGIVVEGTHYHSIERDARTDYGAGT